MTEKKSMRAVVMTAFGGPDRLTLLRMPRPIPGPDEVLMRVQAAGVGLWDVKVRRGQVGGPSVPLYSRLGIGWHLVRMI